MQGPSLQKLTQAFGPEKAKQIKDLLTKKTKTTDYQSVQNLESFQESYSDRLMEAFNEILNGHGVESLGEDYGYDYVNMGDTYDTTLLFDKENYRILIGTWGDIVESEEGEVHGKN